MSDADRKPVSRAQKLKVAAAVAAAIAMPAEGLRQVAYYDPPGVLTVCYGSTTDVVKGRVYTLEECRQRLDADMMAAVKAVDYCVPHAPPSVLAAFADAAYNLGPRIACDTANSTAARLLRAGKWEPACDQLLRWNKARIAGVLVELPGLTKRRHADRVVCLSGLA